MPLSCVKASFDGFYVLFEGLRVYEFARLYSLGLSAGPTRKRETYQTRKHLLHLCLFDLLLQEV